MKAIRIDHIVLTVHDIDRACRWYAGVFGMEMVVMQDGRKALEFGGEGSRQRIHLHHIGHEVEPHAQAPTAGSADLCLISDVPMPQVLETLRRDEVDMVSEGIVRREGAMGAIESVYVRDLDGNLLEISDYPRDYHANVYPR